jgi:hypothetical protein
VALADEIAANYERFFGVWTKEANTNFAWAKAKPKLVESYQRLAAIRAVRLNVVEQEVSPKSAAFFLEANNDLVTSHVCAHLAAWRAALKFLRSAIENTLYCFYYDSHPIEYRLWETGQHKLGFSAGLAYMSRHPDLDKLDAPVTGLQQLEDEYATLSKAVHASSRMFRMTEGEENILLWKKEDQKLGAWSTREKHTIEALVLLTLSLFPARLRGAQNSPTRDALRFATSKASRKRVKESLAITI